MSRGERGLGGGPRAGTEALSQAPEHNLGPGPTSPRGEEPEQPLGGRWGTSSPAPCRVAQSPGEVTVAPPYSLAWEHRIGSQSPVSKGLEVQVEPYDPTSQKGKRRPRGFRFVARALGRGAETLVPEVPAQGRPHVLPGRGRTEKGWKAGCDPHQGVSQPEPRRSPGHAGIWGRWRGNQGGMRSASIRGGCGDLIHLCALTFAQTVLHSFPGFSEV